MFEVDRWAGASIGACTIASFAAKVPFKNFFRVPFAWQSAWKFSQFWKSWQLVIEMMEQSLLPNKEFIENNLLDGKLFISISTFEGIYPKNKVISKYHDINDLLSALYATSAIPGFSMNPSPTFRGEWSIDGGLTSNTPIFMDKVSSERSEQAVTTRIRVQTNFFDS